MNKKKSKLVFKIGAAGGSLSVWLVSAEDGTRSFLVKRNESTLKELMTKEDADGISFKSKIGPLLTFDDALVVLGKYHWHRLTPMLVHKEFREPVLTAVTNLGGEELANRWQRKLNGGFFGHYT